MSTRRSASTRYVPICEMGLHLRIFVFPIVFLHMSKYPKTSWTSAYMAEDLLRNLEEKFPENEADAMKEKPSGCAVWPLFTRTQTLFPTTSTLRRC